MFNRFLELGQVPRKFKTAICTPLYKNRGKYTSSASYRAIYGLSFVVKVFEYVLYNRLIHMTSDSLNSCQHGFRSGRSCETAASLFTQDVFESIDKTSGKVVAVFVDFRKAFDTLNHKTLLTKLMGKYDYNVESYMLKFIQNYFTDRSFRIRNADYLSKEFSIASGTPAGSCLGPLTFSLYINDIGEAMSLPYYLYADDLVFFTNEKNVDVGKQQLSDCYASLKTWCKNNSLEINVLKTKTMLFHKAHD